jgi:hypothetical protein
MPTTIYHIHHVGHVVHDLSNALALYRQLGFACLPPAYPAMAEKEGGLPKPFGAANTHIPFLRNFIEIVTVVKDGQAIPADARLVPLQVPPPVLPRVLENIRRTVATVAQCLARGEGTHILCFSTNDIGAAAGQLDAEGVRHGGINVLQRPLETTEGVRMVPVRVLEIDGEEVVEGRLALADQAPPEVLQRQTNMNHPNGAVELDEVILCVANRELDGFASRYRRYLGSEARTEGMSRLFDLGTARIRIVPQLGMQEILPGEAAPPLPGFAGYAVKVADLTRTRQYLTSRGFPVVPTLLGGIFVPAAAALGTAIVFRQVT